MKVVFIHTRDRFKFLEKVIPAWLAKKPDAIIPVVEPDEWATTRNWLRQRGWLGKNKPHTNGATVWVMRLRKRNAGMGSARREVVNMAQERRLSSFIMSDDDIFPRKDADPWRLLEFVEEERAMGIGACVSFYGLSLGNDYIRDSDEAIPVSGSWGYRLFALNTRLAIAAGNFDPALTVGWEDHELCRGGIKLGYQWHIHTGVMANSIGARYAPGGIATLLPNLAERKAGEKRCHEHIFERWGPRYISDPSKGYRCNWRRLLTDHGLGG